MEHQVSQLTLLGTGMLIGLLLGAGVMWLVLRKLAGMTRIEAKSDSQSEITRLNERLSSCL